MKISVLSLARRRSRFLGHFLCNFFVKTHDLNNTELLIMANSNDDWHVDLFKYFGDRGVKFLYEDRKLGHKGRHLFFNELASHATGDWVLDTCDDQMFIKDGWDNYLREYITLNSIDQNKINVIIPRFDNTGSVNHCLSKGYLKTTGRVGNYGNVDSWLNSVIEGIPQNRIHHPSEILMRDLTLYPEILSPDYLKQDLSEESERLISWAFTNRDTSPLDHAIIQNDINVEISKLKKAITHGL